MNRELQSPLVTYTFVGKTPSLVSTLLMSTSMGMVNSLPLRHNVFLVVVFPSHPLLQDQQGWDNDGFHIWHLVVSCQQNNSTYLGCISTRVILLTLQGSRRLRYREPDKLEDKGPGTRCKTTK